MFSGTYRFRIDAKGRLAIPVRFRGELPQGSHISIGPDTALVIYPPEQWAQLGQQLPAPLSATPEERRLARVLHSLAIPAEFDAQGRVTLSADQRRWAEIEPNSTVCVVGVGQVVEIWPERRWDSYQSAAMSAVDETVNQVIGRS